MNVHFSHKTDEWSTPDDVFAELDREFLLDLDVCANPLNAKKQNYFVKGFDGGLLGETKLETLALADGLVQDWSGRRCWMNPPYGRKINAWIEKAATGGADIVVALLPARTDTDWFHRYLYHKENVEIRFIKGRLKFGGSKNSAPFPSMVVIFR